MHDPEQPISRKQLIKLAGKGAFDRGETYFNDGCVVDWRKKGKKILGTVAGNHNYAVTLTLTQQGLEGFCDCPASEGMDFCKHCVALALHYNRELEDEIRDAEKQQQLRRGNQGDRIQGYLESLDKHAVIEHLLEMINADRELKHEWSIKADAALGLVDVASLKKRITAALPLKRHLYRYPQVRGYFARVEPVIELLQQQLLGVDAAKALTLVEYALERMDKALETIDDSGGFRLTAEEMLQDMHVQTLQRLPWSRDKIAAHLYQKTKSAHDLYPDIPGAYVDALGEAGYRHFVQLARRDWDDLPPLPAGADWQQKSKYWYLQHFLTAQAIANDDFPEQIRIESKTAITVHDFLALSRLCMEHNAWPEAEAWLQRARDSQAQTGRSPAAYRHNAEHTIIEQQIQIHEHFQRYPEALALQWQLFTENPSSKKYDELVQLEQHTGTNAMAEKAKQWLYAAIADTHTASYERRSSLHSLFVILLNENALDAAEALTQSHTIKPKLLVALARQLSRQPQRALPLYEKAISDTVAQGGNDNYRTGVEWLKEYNEQTTGNKKHQSLFTDLLSRLRQRFKPKRNFIAYINEAFDHAGIN